MSATIEVQLPDGATAAARRARPVRRPRRVDRRATGEGRPRGPGATAQLSDLLRRCTTGQVRLVTPTPANGREVLRHSTAHVLAQAVLRLWPGAHYAIGPVIADGFYYDFELPGGEHFSDDDLARIEAVMREIVAEDQPFIRHEYSIDEGLELFKDQPFKAEIIRP